ncbi:peroxide stress protein YaaA [Shewanella sp. FJAT-52076]|uniref:peroxide stress protein YaaA n=1 Tax=Shewanella sp. FJAT-52076 TaxID=2864202 RepID=UPI001C65B7A8|nr:peroxide stress protein YaaA [Shewanella sp. FJAT-52076]QYJ76277.1 peroxide stress protein YaaA [Shewanella sp. FJAT-52076]
MLVVISPAKTLDYDHPAPTELYTLPELVSHSAELIEVCKGLTPADIASLMSVSDKIAGLNAARFASWTPSFSLENAKQALFAFRGDVYTGLDADSLSAEQLEYAQSHLRMLSGLYGVLKPLDLMHAYRLEMGTALGNGRGKNLYEFWGNIITDKLNEALAAQGDDILVNLASNEYFKAVKAKRIEGTLVNPVFKDAKNGQYKIISFYAKKARGLMARFILTTRPKSIEDLKGFDCDGYYYSPEQSTPNTPVFLREER